MSNVLTFPQWRLDVPGIPQPQGSARCFCVRGRGVVTTDNPKLKPWRQAITLAALMNPPAWSDLPHGDHESYNIALTFRLPRPAAARWRPWVVTRPDLDKLTRGVFDALTQGAVWTDDSQVTHVEAAKVYAVEGEDPGVAVRVLRHTLTKADAKEYLR